MTPNELILAGGFALLAAVCLWRWMRWKRTAGFYEDLAAVRRDQCNDLRGALHHANFELFELRAFKKNQDDIRARANAKKRAKRAGVK